MATRAVITDVRTAVTRDFPSHPKLKNPPDLTTRDEAANRLRELLLDSSWHGHIEPWWARFDEDWIRTRLDRHEAELRQALDDGSWTLRWSGKELLRSIASHLINRKPSIPDLARGLAELRRGTDGFSLDLVELHSVLRHRVGLAR